MEALKINQSIKFRFIEALKEGNVRSNNFPELNKWKTEPDPSITEEDREICRAVMQRINSNPANLERFSPSIKLDKSFKIRILSALVKGVIIFDDFPELREQNKGCGLGPFLTKEESQRLWLNFENEY